ncbi:hypothetical protein [Paracidovorax citrulli]
MRATVALDSPAVMETDGTAWHPPMLARRWLSIRGVGRRERRTSGLPAAVAIAAALLTGTAGWQWRGEEALQGLRREQAETARLGEASRQAVAGPDRPKQLLAHDEAQRRLSSAEREWGSEDMQALLLRLHGAASAAQVRIERVRPIDAHEARAGMPATVLVQVAGGYSAVLQWIALLGTLPEAILVDDVELSAPAQMEGVARLTVMLRCFLNGPPASAEVPAAWRAFSPVMARDALPPFQPPADAEAHDLARQRRLPEDIDVESLRLQGTMRSGSATAAVLRAGGELFLARAGQQLDRQGARLCRVAVQQAEVCKPERGQEAREGRAPDASDSRRLVLRLEGPT